MNIEEAKEILKEQEPIFLEEARKDVGGHITYVCPVCANGSGEDGDGIVLDTKNKTGKKYKCFVCGKYEDIIGLYKLKNNVSYIQAIKELCEIYSISLDKEQAEYQPKAEKQPTKKEGEKMKNLQEYFIECNERVTQTDYFTKRGLSKKTIQNHKLGYEPNFIVWYQGEDKKWISETWQAVIIPTSDKSYIARNTNPKSDKERYRVKGEKQIYRKNRLVESNKPIFIVEGEIDALSIIEAGGEAVALSSTSNQDNFINEIEKHKPTQPLILALDNDEVGRKATQELSERLTQRNIKFYRGISYGVYKDANEMLINDRKGLETLIQDIETRILELIKQEKEERKQEYQKQATSNYIEALRQEIEENKSKKATSTGFKQLDRVLGGGLYNGLYILGAISSLGKTTLALQIADQIAQHGNDVMTFSLEMARTELMAKSISRETAKLCETKPNLLENKEKYARTTRQILQGITEENENSKIIVTNAFSNYIDYAKNIYIHEGIGNIGVKEIREAINRHIQITGNRPIVVIDYIQILAPNDVKATDKQNLDKTILELKRISRDFKIAVIGISSLNRASYQNKIKMEAFKESGAIEYGSDVLIGLQFKGVSDSEKFDIDKARAEKTREIELVILKNRNGITGKNVDFTYDARYNYFKEI